VHHHHHQQQQQQQQQHFCFYDFDLEHHKFSWLVCLCSTGTAACRRCPGIVNDIFRKRAPVAVSAEADFQSTRKALKAEHDALTAASARATQAATQAAAEIAELKGWLKAACRDSEELAQVKVGQLYSCLCGGLWPWLAYGHATHAHEGNFKMIIRAIRTEAHIHSGGCAWLVQGTLAAYAWRAQRAALPVLACRAGRFSCRKAREKIGASGMHAAPPPPPLAFNIAGSRACSLAGSARLGSARLGSARLGSAHGRIGRRAGSLVHEGKRGCVRRRGRRSCVWLEWAVPAVCAGCCQRDTLPVFGLLGRPL
jgi:hypothetical protein